MYLDFYNLRVEPFQITPNPEFLYLSPSHREALAAITYAVQEGKGFMVLVGEVGMGKTTLLQAFLKQRRIAQGKVIYLFSSRFSLNGLLRALLRELDLEADGDDTQTLLDHIYRGLIQEYARGNNVILLVDEAQGMPVETLEGLRLISNLETPTDKLLQIVLVGQSELEDKLDLFELRQLRQRIAVKVTLSPLTREESLEYLRFRVEKAGGRIEDIFTSRALAEIAGLARGIPRTLNILADNALVTGFGYQRKPVTVKIVREAVSDQEGGERSFFRSLAPAAVLVSLLTVLVTLGVSIYYQPPVSDSKISVALGPADPIPPRTGLLPEKENLPPASTGPQASSPVTREKEPQPVEVPPVPEKKESRPRESHGPFPLTRTARQGENLYRMILEVYGVSNPELWSLVRQHNPRIKADLKIMAGQKILFPERNKMANNGE
jgi:general secretion pathway protein A